MENSIINVALLGGVIVGIAALVKLVFPPKKINGLYGYRTSGSRASQQRWDFAQRYASLRMLEAAAILIVAGAAMDYFKFDETVIKVVGIGLMLASCAYFLIRTESQLNKRFPKP